MLSEGVLVRGTDAGLRLNPGPGPASPALPREVSWAGGDRSSLPAPSIAAGSLLGSGTSEENKENDLRPPLPQSYAATVARPSASAASTVPGEWARGAWVVTVPGERARGDLGGHRAGWVGPRPRPQISAPSVSHAALPFCRLLRGRRRAPRGGHSRTRVCNGTGLSGRRERVPSCEHRRPLELGGSLRLDGPFPPPGRSLSRCLLRTT